MSELGFYRHVVLLKFKKNVTADTVAAIETAFQAFCAGLPLVKGFEWGINSSTEQLNDGYSHCFLVTFAGPADRDTYLTHPDHLGFVKTWLDANLDGVLVLDYAARD